MPGSVVDFRIDTDQFEGARLFVGCPMYDGRCHSEFTLSLCQLSGLCTQLGIALRLYFERGDALVMKARNAIADRFLQSDATHIMLIDADIGFNPLDVLALLELQRCNAEENAYDVVSAPYPRKRIAWDKVAEATRQGLVDGDAKALERFASDISLHPALPGTYDLSQPLEVSEAGTGFMMIRRKTLERFQTSYPHRRYKAGERELEADLSPVLTQFFDTAIDGQVDTLEDDLTALLLNDPGAGRDEVMGFLSSRTKGHQEYVSEDYMFCRLVRRMGLKVWTCPWMELTHVGSYKFSSRLADLARLGPV